MLAVMEVDMFVGAIYVFFLLPMGFVEGGQRCAYMWGSRSMIGRDLK